MTTNPMQRKSRNAFILGMIIALLIGAAVAALLYMKINSLQKELEEVSYTMNSVYVLNQDVESGQVLTPSMFTTKQIPTITTPAGSTTNIVTSLNSYSLCDTNGTPIQMTKGNNGYTYFMKIDDTDCTIYKADANGQEIEATSLMKGDKAYYYKKNDKNSEKQYITIAENAVIAKIAMNANTVICNTMISRADELYSDDTREQEYNMLSLPIDLLPGEYVDIRLALPNGGDYIVVSKKQVDIPVSNGAYVADTIKVNLTEEETLLMSCAIVEAYKTEGAKIYVSKYVEAGLQIASTGTYIPSEDLCKRIQNNPNIVTEAKNELIQRYNSDARGENIRNNQIDGMINKYENEDNIKTEVSESVTSSQEARKDYLQSIVPTTN